MPDDPPLRPATPEEVSEALSYAMRFNRSGKPVRSGYEFMSKIAADWLVEHLRLSNFVIMKKPPAKPHSTG
jgi:hypothetical protein